jgi:hypothetical protein
LIQFKINNYFFRKCFMSFKVVFGSVFSNSIKPRMEEISN